LVSNVDTDARDLYERDLVLIRQDQHVAWRGNNAPDPDRLVTHVVGKTVRKPSGPTGAQEPAILWTALFAATDAR